MYLLKLFIRHKAWSYLVIMLSFIPLIFQLLGDIEVRKLGWLDEVCVNFESEGTKAFIINAPSGLNIFLYVFAETFND